MAICFELANMIKTTDKISGQNIFFQFIPAIPPFMP